jgi:hypothetical protein
MLKENDIRGASFTLVEVPEPSTKLLIASVDDKVPDDFCKKCDI